MTRIISHRGNLDGPNIFKENDPKHLEYVLKTTNFDIEIDVRATKRPIGMDWYLGHDQTIHLTSLEFILTNRFWRHAKTIDTWLAFNDTTHSLQHFYHTDEHLVRVGYSFTWLYPGAEKEIKFMSKSSCILVLPELTYGDNIDLWNIEDYYGVCTDYPLKAKEYLNAKQKV